MITSMTGYGRADSETQQFGVTAEIKAVNHRYLDVYVKINKRYVFLEDKIKAALKKYVSRGKVEIYVGITELAGDKPVRIDDNLAEGYIAALRTFAARHGLVDDIKASTLISFSDIFIEQADVCPADQQLMEAVLSTVQNACRDLVKTREKEGEFLKADISNRLDAIDFEYNLIERKSPETVAAYAEKLRQNVRQLMQNTALDENRLMTEIALHAEKLNINEELVRFKAHMQRLDDLLNNTQSPAGRRMDFLLQELNREINTIGSKANDVDVAVSVINIKAELEKIREQAQNIE